jgi:hypothetical protein
VTDPRAQDVAETERLLATAADQGAAQLPMLSAAEIYAVCGTAQVLLEEEESRWWDEMADGERRKITAAAVDFLIDRRLLRRPDANDRHHHDLTAAQPGRLELPMAAPLALVVAARQYPAVVATGSRPDGVSRGLPRLYGLAEDGAPVRAFVMEVVTGKVHKLFGPLHELVLMSPASAGQALARWAQADLFGGRRGRPARRQDRDLSVLRNGPGIGLRSEKLTITPAGDGTIAVSRPGAVGQDQDAAAPMICGAESVAGMLTGMLIEGSS